MEAIFLTVETLDVFLNIEIYKKLDSHNGSLSSSAIELNLVPREHRLKIYDSICGLITERKTLFFLI